VSGGFLEQAFIYLCAAVVAVPVAQRLGLGSVLGYLLAGVAIGPFGLGLLGAPGGEDVMHVAEFGVVMMLFVVGLELEPARLWRLRGPILGLGGLQVVVTSAVFAALALAVGLPWRAALAVGMTLSLSSTAIVLQSLSEKGLLKTAGGQSAFAVLLFQDIAVIPMLALFPLLAAGGAADAAAHAGESWVHGRPAWVQTLAVLGAVGGVAAGARWVVRPAFAAVARTKLREIFTAAALFLVVGIALLMTRVGLSPALGTFLAGVVLATSEYRHELEGDVEPFKGLLLGLFFIAVGATIDFAYIVAHPLLVAGLVLGLLAVKLAILVALGRAFKLGADQSLLFGFALPQVGEFAFVLLAFAAQAGVLDGGVTRPLVAAVALTMACTPLLMLANERLVQPRFGRVPEADARPSDARDDGSSVLIAGFGGFGSTIGRLLRANNVPTTVLDVDSDNVDVLRAMGLEVYYGDASRLDLLRAAGAERARILVLALGSPGQTMHVVRTAQRHFPHLEIFARAFDWDDAHELLAAGVTHVYRESLDTSLRAGADAMRLLGFRAHQAQRAAQKFRRHDEDSQRALTEARADERAYVSQSRQRIEDLELLLRRDLAERALDADEGWDAESLRADVLRGSR
jgi:monovalent cation:proton antiporter-2 (CPA2) family protein